MPTDRLWTPEEVAEELENVSWIADGPEESTTIIRKYALEVAKAVREACIACAETHECKQLGRCDCVGEVAKAIHNLNLPAIIHPEGDAANGR